MIISEDSNDVISRVSTIVCILVLKIIFYLSKRKLISTHRSVNEVTANCVDSNLEHTAVLKMILRPKARLL